MLNDREIARLEETERRLARGEAVPLGEARWLCSALRRTGLARPDSFDFPEYAGLVDLVKESAFALRIVGTPDYRQETTVGKDGFREGAEILRKRVSVDSHDAVLVVNPWVRAHASTLPGAFEDLRRCVLTLTFDGEEVVSREDVGRFLLGPDGAAVSPRVAPLVARRSTASAYAAARVDSTRAQVDGKDQFGCFVSDKTEIVAILEGPSGTPGIPLRVIAGLAAAHYTTRPDAPRRVTKGRPAP